MKKFVFAVLFLILSSISTNSFASHIYGGDLLYKQAGNTVTVTLTLYGDCSGSSFGNLPSSVPVILIYKDGVQVATITLAIVPPDSGLEVSPVCPAYIDSTTCKVGGTYPGVKKFVFEGNYTLTGPASANWQFIFDGDLSKSGGSAGRSYSITNVRNTSSSPSVMYLVATLNNLNGSNSSPTYTTIPTPYYCLNVLENYNQGASDPDGDSLVFSLVPGLVSTGVVSYVPPYTYLEPLGTDTFAFDTLTGQMTFRANLLQRALVVSKVSEYRNGVLVGSSMREMTVIILDNCNNSPPGGKITNVIGGASFGNTVAVCQGDTALSFDINVTDPDGDTVVATINGFPAFGINSIVNNTTKNPIIHTKWNLSGVSAGSYYFYVTYKDRHCPLSSTQTIAYTVSVVQPNTVVAKVVSPTQCIHNAGVALYFSNGLPPRNVQITLAGTTVKSFIDIKGLDTIYLPAGTYHVQVKTPGLSCITDYDFTVVDSGALAPLVAPSVSYCLGDAPAVLSAVSTYQVSTITWYDALGNPVIGPPTPNTDNAGRQVWYVNQKIGVCVSPFDTVVATVHPEPQTVIENNPMPGRLCIGDVIYLVATGAKTYKWTSNGNAINFDRNKTPYSIALDTATYTVVGTDAYGCKDTVSITYSEVLPCCYFGYPNAFTPNGDGKNDRFKIVTDGNMTYFLLHIYNRWGQCVFLSDNPKMSWDGNYYGQPCDIGTYYFYLEAKCITGHVETHKGDITLIR